MNIQPIPDYRYYTCKSSSQEKGKTPPKVNLTKPQIEVNNEDKFVRSVKEPVDNKVNKRIGVMFSSGGGTN